MPIKPIDMLSMAPRSQEASQQHLNNNQRAMHAQESLQSQFAADVKQSSEKVINTLKSENTEYRYDAKEKGNGKYKGNKKKNNKNMKQKNEKLLEAEKNKFDIRI